MASIDYIDKKYFLMVTPHSDIGQVQDSDISKSCDICGEGRSKGRKHRLHLYIKDTYDSAAVACFNCGYSGNLYSYLKENHPREYELYKKEKRGNVLEELKMVPIEQPKLETLETSNPEVNVNLIDPISSFVDLPDDVIIYLESRGIKPQKSWRYSPVSNKIIFNKKEIMLNDFIIIPLTYNNRWYGFQALGWKQKKFFVYLVDGNTSWKVWNWDCIDKDKPVYIFESIYDALSSGETNIIAQLGANIHEDRLKELKEPIFCLDNQNIDEAAYRETLKYLELGHKCFIWPNKIPLHFKDYNDLLKRGVTTDKIKTLINKNIFSGMTGIIRLKTL